MSSAGISLNISQPLSRYLSIQFFVISSSLEPHAVIKAFEASNVA
jgi:hypothetical protein